MATGDTRGGSARGGAVLDRHVEFVGQSAATSRLLESVARIARTQSTTLILGETGTGKDLIATMLHTRGARCAAPFVAVNCAAVQDELVQSEIFGHEKGAFTGAHRLKHGLFEVANGGTLFLDEVGDTSAETQSKLLRVLESGCFRRVGGTREISVDVRVVAATNRDLGLAVSRKQFREDLFYRLTTFTLSIPPLRARPEDIPILAACFLERFNRRGARSKRLDPLAMEALIRYTWPGNVRELIHVIEQSAILSDADVISVADLPPEVSGHPIQPPHTLGSEIPTLQEVERRHLHWVLGRMNGNRAQAARALGVSERTFYRLLARHR